MMEALHFTVLPRLHLRQTSQFERASQAQEVDGPLSSLAEKQESGDLHFDRILKQQHKLFVRLEAESCSSYASTPTQVSASENASLVSNRDRSWAGSPAVKTSIPTMSNSSQRWRFILGLPPSDHSYSEESSQSSESSSNTSQLPPPAPEVPTGSIVNYSYRFDPTIANCRLPDSVKSMRAAKWIADVEAQQQNPGMRRGRIMMAASRMYVPLLQTGQGNYGTVEDSGGKISWYETGGRGKLRNLGLDARDEMEGCASEDRDSEIVGQWWQWCIVVLWLFVVLAMGKYWLSERWRTP